MHLPTSFAGATCDRIALDMGPIMPRIKPNVRPKYNSHQTTAVALTVLSKTQLAKAIMVMVTIENFKSCKINVNLK